MTIAGQVLIVTKNPSFYGKLIQWFTKSEAYHTAGIISDIECMSAETPRVVVRRIDEFPDSIITDIPMTDEQVELAVASYASNEDKPYAYFDIVLLVISKWLGKYTPDWITNRVQDQHRVFCSEMCDAGLLAADIELFPGKRDLTVTPADFLNVVKSKERV